MYVVIKSVCIEEKRETQYIIRLIVFTYFYAFTFINYAYNVIQKFIWEYWGVLHHTFNEKKISDNCLKKSKTSILVIKLCFLSNCSQFTNRSVGAFCDDTLSCTLLFSFETPLLTSPDNASTSKAGKTVDVKDGINPANIGKIFLLFSYYKSIVFLTFLLSCLSLFHMLSLVCQVVILLWE